MRSNSVWQYSFAPSGYGEVYCHRWRDGEYAGLTRYGLDGPIELSYFSEAEREEWRVACELEREAR